MRAWGYVAIALACSVVAGAGGCGSGDDGSGGSDTASNGGDGGAGTGGAGGGGGSSASGGGSGTGGGSLLDAGNLDAAPLPSTIQLTGTLRDFHDTHPDFEGALGDDRGLVAAELGTDGKPVYVGGAGTTTTSGAEAFDQWFRDVPGVNTSMPYTITLERESGNLFTYDNQEFFPADGQLFGNEGRDHNYHFTYEIRTKFRFLGGEVFRFTGDDDLFVFINGRLAIDLGGVHGAQSAEADLGAMKGDLGIEEGNEYTLDFFFAERHTTQSTFRIETTIGSFTQVN